MRRQTSRAFRSTSRSARRARSSSSRHVVPPATMFSRLPLLLVVLGVDAARTPRRWRSRSSPSAASAPAAWSSEIASNDGYLLQYFQAAGVPVLGIEPAAQRRRGGTRRDAASRRSSSSSGATLAARLAAEGTPADVILGLNVMAHVPDFNGFVRGPRGAARAVGRGGDRGAVRARHGRATEFDTIYHEHLCYFSVSAVAAAASAARAGRRSAWSACRCTAARCGCSSAAARGHGPHGREAAARRRPRSA